MVLVALSEAYLSVYERLREEKLTRSKLLRVVITLYGKRGAEWVIRGEELVYEGGKAVILRALVRGGEYTIRAKRLIFDRLSSRGLLEGDVEITGPDLYIKTERAFIDFKRNVAWGDGDVLVRRKGNLIRGRGFKIYFKPFRVILDEVKSVHPSS
ncbi:MAG: LPS export ABC transporter periplasmic protein LptC [Aquificae bacterium]|nr:LPS export ABC transporter periplasmic protein LptC [Aquificota bacterium]